jgi:HSP20 family protein
MTIMTSWDLFEDLRDAQDEMMRVNRMRTLRLGQLLDGGANAPGWVPAIDISERKDAYVVSVELPGVRMDDQEITFQDGLLTIQGERRNTYDVAVEKAHRIERHYGAFRRSITLPSHVKADKIEASTQDGVLQILVPKSDEARARHIQVRATKGHTALAPGAKSHNGA